MSKLKYKEFIKNRLATDNDHGFDVSIQDMNSQLFEWQKHVVRLGLKRGRFALFADCGLGKTPMQLEWADHVNRYSGDPVLIVAPLAVANQTMSEGLKFGKTVKFCHSKDDMADGLNITNYEKINNFIGLKASVVFDESSIFKGTNYKKTFQICKKIFAESPYILCCSATPAPNDYPELGNHSEILRVKTRGEMLSEFFIHDGGDTQKYRLKGWGDGKYWQWITTWAISIRRPSDIGFEDTGYDLPPIKYHEHFFTPAEPLPGKLFIEDVVGLQERRMVRRETVDHRAKIAADIINKSDRPALVFCELNSESESLTKMIDGAVEVAGKHSIEEKTERILAFQAGKVKALVTKPSIAGFGMNFQEACADVFFVGLSDSFEKYYQGVRRVYRFLQTKQVNIHFVLDKREGSIIANVKRKERDAEKMIQEMVRNTADITRADISSGERVVFHPHEVKVKSGDGWTLYNGDCVDVIRDIADESIGYQIYSPPFASLYTYSDNERDMGNARTYQEFFQHYSFLVSEKYRVCQPGRLVSIHCMNIPAIKEREGYIGLKNFRDDIIRLHQEHGFIYHSEVLIWKDPLIEAVRTKSKGLQHKQIMKDSSCCRQGLPDYLVTMMKPGENMKRIAHPDGFTEYVGELDPGGEGIKKSHNIWRKYASPVWMDIRQTHTLNKGRARDGNDEAHICPLQLDVIERALELWSAKGDLVASWFAGIGSEGYQAIKMGREFVGSELKESYWREAVKNLSGVKKEKKQMTIEDVLAS